MCLSNNATRGGAFRSSSDPGEGTRAPGASWASLAATSHRGSALRSLRPAAAVLIVYRRDYDVPPSFIVATFSGVLTVSRAALATKHVDWRDSPTRTTWRVRSPRRDSCPAAGALSRAWRASSRVVHNSWG